MFIDCEALRGYCHKFTTTRSFATKALENFQPELIDHFSQYKSTAHCLLKKLKTPVSTAVCGITRPSLAVRHAVVERAGLDCSQPTPRPP